MTDPQPSGLERRKARDDRVVTTLLLGRLVCPQGDTVCRIRNFSQGGAKIELRIPLAIGDAVSIELRGTVMVPGKIAWIAGNSAGVAFDDLIDSALLLGDPGAGFKQRSPRLEADCSAVLRVMGHAHSVRLLDIGQRGARVGGAAKLPRDTSVRLEAPGLGHMPAVVRWASPDALGLFFPDPIPFVMLSAWSQDSATRFCARASTGTAGAVTAAL